MVRQAKGRHNVVVTGTNDGTKQVSKDAWNDDHNETGMEGYDISAKTLSSGALAITSSYTQVNAETGSADTFDNVTNTDTAEEDIIYLIAASGDTITVNHQAGGAGQFHLLNNLDVILSENIPLVCVRKGDDWYQVSSDNSAIVAGSRVEVLDY